MPNECYTFCAFFSLMPCPSALSKHFWHVQKILYVLKSFGRVQKIFGHVLKFWTYLFLQILSISSNFAPQSNFLDTSKNFEHIKNFLTTFKNFLNTLKNFGWSRWTGHKIDFFWYFKVRLPTSLEPLGVRRHLVPCFKGLISLY